jgi:hypothetical protein
MRVPLIPFKGKNVVRFLGYDELSNMSVGSHGIDGDDVAFEIEFSQELWDGRNLIGFFGNKLLGEGHAGVSGPRADGNVGALI